MKYDYFIIGNSAAAVGCIEGIRRESKNGKICVVSDENYRAYGRPLISYFLWGKTSEENMLKYRPKDFYEKNGATETLMNMESCWLLQVLVRLFRKWQVLRQWKRSLIL